MSSKKEEIKLKCCLCKRKLKDEQEIKDGNWRSGEYIEYLRVPFTDYKQAWERVVCYECIDVIVNLFAMTSDNIKSNTPLIVGDTINYQTDCRGIISFLIRKYGVAQDWASEMNNKTTEELVSELEKLREMAIVWATHPGKEKVAFLKDLIKFRKKF